MSSPQRVTRIDAEFFRQCRPDVLVGGQSFHLAPSGGQRDDELGVYAFSVWMICD